MDGRRDFLQNAGKFFHYYVAQKTPQCIQTITKTSNLAWGTLFKC